MTLIDPSAATDADPSSPIGTALDVPLTSGTGGRAAAAAPPECAVQGGAVVVIVDGHPEGQGRISYNKHGAGYYSNSKTLKPWRDAVRAAALELAGRHMWEGVKKKPCRRCGLYLPEHAVWAAGIPVKFEAECVFPPVASAPGRLYPTVRSAGDWDHLGRAIGDALTGVLWADDSQIIDGRVTKCYSTDPYAALRDPGAVIWVQRADM